MARSSQDAPAPISRRKTTHVEAKDRILYDTTSRDSRSRTLDTRYDAASTSLNSHQRRDTTTHRPRYSDSIVLLKDTSSNDTAKRDVTRATTTHNQSENRTSSTITSKRILKPQVSLSNMFEEDESQLHDTYRQTHHLPRNAANSGRESYGKPAQGRLRSLSDTSIYSRPDAATFEREPFDPSVKAAPQAALHNKQTEREEDEVSVEYVEEDEEEDFTNIDTQKNEKALFQGGDDDQGKNGKQTVGHDDNQLLSSDDVNSGNNTIGLTEFARMKEKVSVVKQSQVKEKTLAEQAEPLIVDVTQLYEEEWNAAIIAEEALYKQNAKSLGSLLDREMLAAAHGIKNDTQKIWRLAEKAEKVINNEAQAAKKNIASLLAEQKDLLLKFRDIEARIAKRDERIISDIRAIHEEYLEKRKDAEDVYGAKADGLEDKIEAMKSKDALNNGFNNYVAKHWPQNRTQAPSSKPKSNTQRAHTRG